MSALTPWTWVRRALWAGAALVSAGIVAGGLGAFTIPWVGMAIGLFGVCFGGTFWWFRRVGVTAFGAALVGLLVAATTSVEGYRARITRSVEVVELPSLSAWNPLEGAVAMHVGELRHLWEHEVEATFTTSAGKRTSTATEIAVPLLDPAEQRVVGFYCRTAGPRVRQDGAWVLASAAWNRHTQWACDRGVAAAVERCGVAGVAVAPGSEQRLVEVFASEQEFRGAIDLGDLAGIPVAAFALYAVLVVAFRRRGANSV